jgi:hypothetical protein
MNKKRRCCSFERHGSLGRVPVSRVEAGSPPAVSAAGSAHPRVAAPAPPVTHAQ